jgi:hypothetical protein
MSMEYPSGRTAKSKVSHPNPKIKFNQGFIVKGLDKGKRVSDTT